MTTKNFFLLLILALFSINSTAQDTGSRFAFEFNADASFATSNLAGTDLNPGAGFEAIFHYRLMPHTGIYAGWGWNRFNADESFMGDNMDFEETGYIFGLQFKHPLGSTPLAYFVRGGGLYNHIEIENTDGDIIEDTGHGLGWQISGGVEVPLSRKWNIAPSVKFNSLSRNLECENVTHDMDLNYMSVRVAVVRSF